MPSQRILELRWGDIRGQRIRLAEAKAGPRTVWLGVEARTAIDGLARPEKYMALSRPQGPA